MNSQGCKKNLAGFCHGRLHHHGGFSVLGFETCIDANLYGNELKTVLDAVARELDTFERAISDLEGG